MGKVIGISSYIIFIAFVTFIVAGYARANQTVTFLENQETKIYNSPKDLIIATLIANSQGQYDIYIKEEPIMFIQKNEPNYSYEFFMMPVLLYESDQKYQYELVMLITQYENRDASAFMNNEALNLDSTITFEKNLESLSQNIFNEQWIQLYDDSMHMYAISQDYFLNVENDNLIERMDVRYKTTITNVIILTLIHTEAYQDKEIPLPSLYDGDLRYINLSQLQLSSLNDKDTWYQNRSLLNEFHSYQYMTILYLGIEILIIIPITYFIFFHKQLKKLRNHK
jgi:hypothetical protein